MTNIGRIWEFENLRLFYRSLQNLKIPKIPKPQAPTYLVPLLTYHCRVTELPTELPSHLLVSTDLPTYPSKLNHLGVHLQHHSYTGTLALPVLGFTIDTLHL